MNNLFYLSIAGLHAKFKAARRERFVEVLSFSLVRNVTEATFRTQIRKEVEICAPRKQASKQNETVKLITACFFIKKKN